MRLAKLLLTTSLLIVFSFALYASETDRVWTAVLYDESANSLVMLAPDGVTTYPLPNVGYQADVIKVSDDFRYAIGLFNNHYDNNLIDEVTIIDLNTNIVRYIPPLPLEDNEIFVDYTRMAFKYDMTEIAVAYISHDMKGGFGCCDSGGIVIVELASGEITHHLDIDADVSIPSMSSAWLDAWTREGLWFAPRCATCTPTPKFFYQIWNPYDDTVTPTTRYDDLMYAERLESTGELLYGENHDDYPAGGLTFINDYVALNVVSIYQLDESPPDTDGQVVYFDIENLQFERPHWVMGGQAFLIQGAKNAIVFRNGALIEFDADWKSTEFLVMTTDGWLAKDAMTGEVLHYSVENNQVVRDVLYQSHGRLILANHLLEPLRGQLPAFTQDIAPPDEPFCYGNLPVQLHIGDYARTLNSNSVLGGLWIGDGDVDDKTHDNVLPIPVNSIVRIIDGTECLDHVWVKVDYKGKIGWMVETWWGIYYLEPIDPPIGMPYIPY